MNKVRTYAILIDDVDNDDELAIVFAVVNESDTPDFNITLERLQLYIHIYIQNEKSYNGDSN